MDSKKSLVLMTLMLGLMVYSAAARAADEPAQEKAPRWDIQQVLELDDPKAIVAPVAAPEQQEAAIGQAAWISLDERLVSAAEKELKVRIARDSMIKSQKCLQDIFTSNTHLVKMAVGLRVVGMKVVLSAHLSKHSLISPFKARKLERPELTITLRYDRADIPATRMVFSGYKYH